MTIAGMFLGCLLLSQTADAGVADGGANRWRPADRIAQALELPADAALTGRPLALADVLASAPDRRRQLEATRAYWGLVQAVGEYRLSSDYVRDLAAL